MERYFLSDLVVVADLDTVAVEQGIEITPLYAYVDKPGEMRQYSQIDVEPGDTVVLVYEDGRNEHETRIQF